MIARPVDYAARRRPGDARGQKKDQRQSHHLLVQVPGKCGRGVPHLAALEQLLAMVGGDHDHCVACQVGLFEHGPEPSEPCIELGNTSLVQGPYRRQLIGLEDHRSGLQTAALTQSGETLVRLAPGRQQGPPIDVKIRAGAIGKMAVEVVVPKDKRLTGRGPRPQPIVRLLANLTHHALAAEPQLVEQRNAHEGLQTGHSPALISESF